MKPLHKKLFGLLAIGMLSVSRSFAEGLTFTTDEPKLQVILGLIMVIAFLVLFVALYVWRILGIIIEKTTKSKTLPQDKVLKPIPSWWSRLSQVLNDSVPIDQEATIELDHSYDGIRELDNHLPPWWKYMAYLTIAFAMIYIYVYHISGSMPLQLKEYENELASAELAKASLVQDSGDVIDENTIVFNDDPAIIANGKKVYEMQCVACHKADGAGGIGPNLADEYWIHGGDIKDIFKTVRYGVPDKGMIAWEGVLSLSNINDITMYIRTLKGTVLTDAKGPQGELYTEE